MTRRPLFGWSKALPPGTFAQRARRKRAPRPSLPVRMVDTVRRCGPISHLDLQRRVGLRRGDQRITLIMGPQWEGCSKEFCQALTMLVLSRTLRVIQHGEGWKKAFRIALGRKMGEA